MFFSAPSASSYRARRGGADYSEDSERLPDGMQRCGYDADTQRHTFRDTATGALWEGGAGVVYGRMTRVSGGGGGGQTPVVSSVQRISWREEVVEEEADEGEVAVLGFEGVVRAVWEVVLDAPRRERERERMRDKDEKGLERGRRSTPGLVRRLGTLRRPRGAAELGRVAPVGESGKLKGRRAPRSLVDVVEGKEVRLALIAAGEKRTIFDVV